MRAAHQRLLRAIVVVVVCVAAPGLVRADNGQARAHFDRGRAFFEVSQYRNAIAEFKAAHVEKPDPAFLYNIAELKAAGEDSKAPAGDVPPGGGDNLALNPPPRTSPDVALIQVPAPREAEPPLYTRPWFLITVGVVIATSAVGIWALSRSPEPPGTALGNQSVF
jgi:hypothetical protein